MKAFNQTAITYITFTVLFIFVSSALAEGEWATNGNNIYSTNAGNVGIGTAKPAASLEISGTGSRVLSVHADNDNNCVDDGSCNPVLRLMTEGNDTLDALIYLENLGGDTKLHFDVENQDALVIHDGNIGIGTDTPMKKLHIQNASVIFDAGFGGNNVQYTYGNRTYRYAFEGNSYNLLLKGKDHYPVLGIDRINGDIANPQPLSDNDEIFQIRTSGTNANGTQTAHVALRVNVEGEAHGDGLNQKLGLLDNKVVIRHSGNVGIGNTDPDHRLVVGPPGGGRHLVINDIPQARWGFVTGNYALRIQNDWGNSWTSRMLISKEGNVGIGNLDPDHKLVVGPPGGGRHLVINDIPQARWGFVTGNYALRIQNDWKNSWTSRMLISKEGNVGIGTTSPSTKLDVNGVTRSKFSIISAGNAAEGGQLTLADGGQYELTGESAQAWNIDVLNSRLRFHRSSSGEKMTITESGNVGIGTNIPQSKLTVNGTITAKEIKVESGWSDFVFDEKYDLASLDEVESFIHENKHLPDIPSAREVELQGVAVSEMLAKQMQKIEEMTLYLIQLKKENDELKERVAVLEGSKKSAVKKYPN